MKYYINASRKELLKALGCDVMLFPDTETLSKKEVTRMIAYLGEMLNLGEWKNRSVFVLDTSDAYLTNFYQIQHTQEKLVQFLAEYDWLKVVDNCMETMQVSEVPARFIHIDSEIVKQWKTYSQITLIEGALRLLSRVKLSLNVCGG